jgi:transcriptional regulator with XRE-family HTH domain
MNKMKDNNHSSGFDNQTIGENIAMHRKLHGLKAADMARFIGISEAAYLKLEKGTSEININTVQKIGEKMNVDPLTLLSQRTGNFIGGIHHSPFGGIGNYVGGDFQMQDEKQTQLMIKLMENMLVVSERLIALMKKLEKTDRG